jgi:hypothetical protein
MIQDKGYLIDINGIDEAKLQELMCADKFRSSLLKVALPWAWNHPAGKPRFCWGLTLNSNVAEESMFYKKELGSTLKFFQPRRFDCELSA